MSEWISVKERLPTEADATHGRVLVRRETDPDDKDQFDVYGWRSPFLAAGGITHWARIPAFP